MEQERSQPLVIVRKNSSEEYKRVFDSFDRLYRRDSNDNEKVSAFSIKVTVTVENADLLEDARLLKLRPQLSPAEQGNHLKIQYDIQNYYYQFPHIDISFQSDQGMKKIAVQNDQDKEAYASLQERLQVPSAGDKDTSSSHPRQYSYELTPLNQEGFRIRPFFSLNFSSNNQKRLEDLPIFFRDSSFHTSRDFTQHAPTYADLRQLQEKLIREFNYPKESPESHKNALRYNYLKDKREIDENSTLSFPGMVAYFFAGTSPKTIPSNRALHFDPLSITEKEMVLNLFSDFSDYFSLNDFAKSLLIIPKKITEQTENPLYTNTLQLIGAKKHDGPLIIDFGEKSTQAVIKNIAGEKIGRTLDISEKSQQRDGTIVEIAQRLELQGSLNTLAMIKESLQSQEATGVGRDKNRSFPPSWLRR